jgi:hypothetical protein
MKLIKVQNRVTGHHKPLLSATVIYQAMPLLRQLVTSLSPQGPGFNPRSVHVGFLVERVTMGQVFVPVLQFFHVQYDFTNFLKSFIHPTPTSCNLRN